MAFKKCPTAKKTSKLCPKIWTHYVIKEGSWLFEQLAIEIELLNKLSVEH